MSSTFRTGDTVSWDSQAGGSWTRKTGQVIEVVPEGHKPLTSPTSRKPWGSPRKEVSYVVEVEVTHSKGTRKEVYWPLVKGLNPAKPKVKLQPDKLTDLLHEVRFLF